MKHIKILDFAIKIKLLFRYIFITNFRRNNSTAADNSSSNSLPQISSLSPAVVPADSLIVTARTTTRELGPNILSLSKHNSSSNSNSNVNSNSEDTTETLVINLKVKKYMEIVRSNSSKSSGVADEELASTTTTATALSLKTTTASTTVSPSTTVSTTAASTTTTAAKKMTKKTTPVRTSTSSTTSSSTTTPTSTTLQQTTSTPPTTSAAATTASSATEKVKPEKPEPNAETGQLLSTNISRVDKEPEAAHQLGRPNQPVVDQEGQAGGPVQLPARPDQREEEQEEEATQSGGSVQLPARPDRPLQLPRQREELKKDLLEAIKRKISKNKPGGGEERIAGGEHQGSVCGSVL